MKSKNYYKDNMSKLDSFGFPILDFELGRRVAPSNLPPAAVVWNFEFGILDLVKNHGFKIPIAVLLLTLLLFISSCQQSGSRFSWSSSQYRAAATALYQRELFEEAIKMYEQYLESPVIVSDDIPKVLYQAGNIYLDNLKQPKAALAKYTILKALYPSHTFNNQLGKKIVQCLELTGRRTDAKHALSSLTDLAPEPGKSAHDGSKVVAQIDDRQITINEMEQAVGKLPDSPLELNQLASQYVAQILIAESAIRKGMANRPDVLKKVDFFRNQILAQENLKEEIKLEPPSQNDLKYYFEAKKARYNKGEDSLKTFEQLIPKIQQDWAQEKHMEKYQEYVQNLLRSDRVKFFSSVSGNQSP